jgi:hypothetical protein
MSLVLERKKSGRQSGMDTGDTKDLGTRMFLGIQQIDMNLQRRNIVWLVNG